MLKNTQLDVSKNRGIPKWMFFFHGKPYEQMDDLGVFPYFWKHPIVDCCNLSEDPWFEYTETTVKICRKITSKDQPSWSCGLGRKK